MDTLKRSDQIALLERSLEYTETGIMNGIFTYPDCGYDLVRQGLANEDRTITIAGRAALWFLDKGPDPTPSKSFETFDLKKIK